MTEPETEPVSTSTPNDDDDFSLAPEALPDGEGKACDDRPLTPEARALEGIEGVEMVVDGTTWLLAYSGVRDALSPVRLRLDESAWLQGQYNVDDLRHAAKALLQVNYDLDDYEAYTIAFLAPVRELKEAVEVALFAFPDRDRTYEDWVVSSLVCNGLDPAQIETKDLGHILYQLVCTGRAMPAGAFISAAAGGRQRNALYAMARQFPGKPGPETESTDPPPATPL